MATGSSDKTVKLWNIGPDGPSMVVSRNFDDVGRVFATTFGPDPEVAFRLAVAGSKGAMSVWDTSTNAAVRKAFGQKVPVKDGEGAVEDRVVGIDADSDESSSDEGEGEGDEDDEEGEGSGDGDESMDED
jgi:periodic tryptophan protein 1